MIGGIVRATIAALLGAVAGAVALAAAYAWRPALTLEMDRPLPRKIASGLYPVERAGEKTFAWTSRRADFRLAEVSRASAWTCTITLRGGRSDPATQPVVDVAVDGITVASATATNDFIDMHAAAAARPGGHGLIVSVTSSTAIVPGPSDPRELGVQVDRLVCRPDAAFAVPPVAAVRNAALSAAGFGAAAVLAGTTLGVAVLAAGTLAAVQAFPLSSGPAPYVGFAGTAAWFALWLAGLSLAIARVMERWRGEPLHGTARFVLLFSATALYVKLLGLLHPSKLLVDAVFHAHRLEWVLDGRYFFTQPMPGGVSFPYAIGLYVFAAPWSAVTNDYVTLLRVTVCAAEVVAGLLLYPLAVRAWGERVTAAIAVVLFNVVPLPYGLVGNANLTNAFGQSAALATLMVASLVSLRSRGLAALVGLFALCSLAFLSHVSTFALLAVTLTALAFFYRWRGGPVLHRTAWSIFGVSVLAAVFAILVYYGHFGEVYKTALRVRANTASAQLPADPASPSSSSTAPVALPLQTRVANAVTFTVAAIGWPILVLAGLGLWRLWVGGMRDRAAFAVAAWGVAGVAFFAVAVMRVDAPFQRYAAEFFGRVLFATYPAAVLLAARGAAWAWRAGVVPGIASAVLLLFAVVIGVQHWAGWFH